MSTNWCVLFRVGVWVLVPYVGVCVLRVCMSFRGRERDWGERKRGREKEIGDRMGDDGLDLITGWNGWEGLRCSAFSIVHSCVQAGAGSTATGWPLPEGLSKRDVVRTSNGSGLTVSRPSLDSKIEDELCTHPAPPAMTLKHSSRGLPCYVSAADISCSSEVWGWNGGLLFLDARWMLNSHALWNCQHWVEWPLKEEADFFIYFFFF